MSQQLLDLAGLNLGSVIVSKLFGQDKEVRLRCAIADVPVRNGVAYMQNVKVNTDDALIEIDGTADRQEMVDIDVNPKAYSLKFSSLRTPLEVRGPFIKPHGRQARPADRAARRCRGRAGYRTGRAGAGAHHGAGRGGQRKLRPAAGQGHARPEGGRARGGGVGRSARGAAPSASPAAGGGRILGRRSAALTPRWLVRAGLPAMGDG